MTDEKKLKIARAALWLTAILFLALIIFTFSSAEGGVPIWRSVNQSAGTFTDSMKTDWVDLQQWGYPTNLRWQVNVDNFSDTTKALYIQVQSSCMETDTLANTKYEILGRFYEDDSFAIEVVWDTTICGGADPCIGKTITFESPFAGVKDDTITTYTRYVIPPIKSPCRRTRLAIYVESGTTASVTNRLLVR